MKAKWVIFMFLCFTVGLKFPPFNWNPFSLNISNILFGVALLVCLNCLAFGERRNK